MNLIVNLKCKIIIHSSHGYQFARGSELEYFFHSMCIDYHISKLHIFMDELKSNSGCQDVSRRLPFLLLYFQVLNKVNFKKWFYFVFSVLHWAPLRPILVHWWRNYLMHCYMLTLQFVIVLWVIGYQGLIAK